MNKALVIGGNGFIGSHLADRLIEDKWDISVLDIQKRRYGSTPDQVNYIQGDLNQLYLVREALVDVDVVFHLAWASIHEIANQDPAADISANLIPSIHLIEACRNAGVRRFVFISSGGTVYGPAESLPILESHPKRPVNGYGITKLMVEKYLQMFNHLYGLDYAVLRPSVPYGPRQNPLGRQGAVAVFLYRVANRLPITIWGDGSISRDYFYISDLVAALLLVADQPISGERVFNIGGSKEISLNDLLVQVEETVGEKAVVKFEPSRKFDAPRIVLDTSLARTVLGWTPKIELPEGLVSTWDWMQKVYTG